MDREPVAEDSLMPVRGLSDFEMGYLAALSAYAYTSSGAWAENGVQYVGATGKTRREAAVEFLVERGFPREIAESIADG